MVDVERDNVDGVAGMLRYGLLRALGVEVDELIVDFACRAEIVLLCGGGVDVSCLRRRML